MKNYTQSSVYREKTTKKDNGDNPYNYQHGLLPLNQPAPFERKEERGKRKREHFHTGYGQPHRWSSGQVF